MSVVIRLTLREPNSGSALFIPLNYVDKTRKVMHRVILVCYNRKMQLTEPARYTDNLSILI